MCVIGSAKLAERGVTAAEILSRYFPGLAISSTSVPAVTSVPSGTRSAAAERSVPPGTDVGAKSVPRGTEVARGTEVGAVLVSLPDDDEGERVTIVRDALRARDELARTLGVTAPPRVTLRFHPTTDDYEKVTGQPWYTSGTIVNGEVHVLPLATLRDRGLLDRTIRHEIVHLLTNSALAGRPAWVREGAAIYFAGEQPVPRGVTERPSFKPEPRPSCPTDNELLHPVSVGALSNAYARARVCFAKQIGAGRNWREIR
jgi:hypothetical protein